MRRFFAIVFPPLAVLLCGKPFSAIFNMFLLPFFWVPAVRHAWAVVDDHHRDLRTRKVTNAIESLQAPLLMRNASEPRFIDRQPIINSPFVGTGGSVFRQRR